MYQCQYDWLGRNRRCFYDILTLKINFQFFLRHFIHFIKKIKLYIPHPTVGLCKLQYYYYLLRILSKCRFIICREIQYICMIDNFLTLFITVIRIFFDSKANLLICAVYIVMFTALKIFLISFLCYPVPTKNCNKKNENVSLLLSVLISYHWRPTCTT